mmetsp:Transcript_4228/g.26885  ORF Transcript_4228/g.26885 Transcript_4228/m.26885 type:complete len:234 (+) Transcript_4228:1196-1897(+)
MQTAGRCPLENKLYQERKEVSVVGFSYMFTYILVTKGTCSKVQAHSVFRNLRRSVQELVDRASEGRLWHCANDRVQLLPVLEDHDGGDASNAVLRGNAGALVRVQLDAFDLLSVLGRDFVDQRCDHPARAAPRGPEIHQDRHVRFQDDLIPIFVRHCAHCIVRRFRTTRIVEASRQHACPSCVFRCVDRPFPLSRATCIGRFFPDVAPCTRTLASLRSSSSSRRGLSFPRSSF